MPRRAWVSDAPDAPPPAVDVDGRWEPAGEINAFQERRLWREVTQELGVFRNGSSDTVEYYLTGDPLSPWVADAAQGRCRPAWLRLDPLGDASVILFARGQATYCPELVSTWPAPRPVRPEGRAMIPLRLSKVDGRFFDVVATPGNLLAPLT